MDIFRKLGAKAIWINGGENLNRYVRFQTVLSLPKIQSVRFYICTDTKYELYVNGILAGFGQYDDFPEHKMYDICDITEYLCEGENLISILAYCQGENSFQHMCGLPMVIFAAEADGKPVFVSDERIKCSDETEFTANEFERINFQRSFNFGFDLRKDNGWREKYVSGDWQNAAVCDDSKIEYIPRPICGLALSDTVCGKVITQGVFSVSKGDNVSQKMQYAALSYREPGTVLDLKTGSVLEPNVYWVSDLGRETAGYLALDIEAEEGACLWIGCGEHLADLRVRSYVGERNFAFSCVCRGGRQKLRFYIKRLAGRYLQFFAFSGIKRVYSAGLMPAEYPLEFESDWHSCDRLMNKIYDVSKRTLRLCMHEHYEDCPQREQALYGMDSRNQMLCGYYAFGETKMPRASIELLGMSQNETGMLEMCAPCVFESVIPSFALAWVIALGEYGMFSADIEFLRKMQPVAKGVLGYFTRLKKDGLVMRPSGLRDWNFYEWTDGLDNMDERGKTTDVLYDAPLNAICAMALSAYGNVCGMLDLAEEAVWSKTEHGEIAAAFHGGFYSEEAGAYKNYISKTRDDSFSELTQALALLGGCVPAGKESDIREKLVSGELTESSLSYLIFKYDALMAEPEVYGEYVLDDIAEKWGRMLYDGATSFWETILGEADFDRAGSLCHGWSAVPIYVFWRYVMGIYPETPGKMPCSAHPVCGKNLFAKGRIKMTDGCYDVVKDSCGVSIEKIV